MALKMYKSDIDSYIATFENLVREASYNRDAKGTMHLFTQGLRPDLLQTLLYLPTIPETMDEWQEKARNEIKKNAYRETLLPSSKKHYKWQFQHSNGNGRHQSRRHPNDETVPMDVDVPIFTQVNRAYTTEDKKQHRLYGKCFNCSKQGHMAKDCPLKKKQQPRFNTSQPTWRTSSSKPTGSFGQRKYNQFKSKKSTQPLKFGQSAFARTASIQEIPEDSDEDEDDVPSLTARAAKFNDRQREQWVEEMKALGINF